MAQSAAKYTRDELLYLAKLAEQCERYDGKENEHQSSIWLINFDCD